MIFLLIKSLGGLFGGFFFPEAMPVSERGGPRVRAKQRRQAAQASFALQQPEAFKK